MNKIMTNFKMLAVFILVLFTSCRENHLPKSINIANNKVYFSLKDNNYKEVLFGTDLIGNWKNFPMKKVDTTWVISFFNPHKEVQYKFFINQHYWVRDALNEQKIVLKPPQEGYNSIVVFK